MSYQIDQSGKIEQTGKHTVIALSNNIQATVILKSKDKKALQEIYRKAGKPRAFVIQVFAALTYLLIEKAKIKEGLIYIDKEYPGHEDIIKSYIIQLINKRKIPTLYPGNIRFMLVGKRSPAHLLGYEAYKKGKADFTISKEDILAMVLNYER